MEMNTEIESYKNKILKLFINEIISEEECKKLLDEINKK